MGLCQNSSTGRSQPLKTTQAVTDGTGENLLTLCLAAYVNKAHEDTPNRYAWSVFHILHSRKTRKSLKNVESGRDSEERAAFGSESLRLRRARLGEMLLEERLVHKP
jgi:hypothetical protein